MGKMSEVRTRSGLLSTVPKQRPATGSPQQQRWLGRGKRVLCDVGAAVAVGMRVPLRLDMSRAIPSKPCTSTIEIKVTPRSNIAPPSYREEFEVSLSPSSSGAVVLEYGPLRAAGEMLLHVALDGSPLGGSPFPLRVRAGRHGAGVGLRSGTSTSPARRRAGGGTSSGRAAFLGEH